MSEAELFRQYAKEAMELANRSADKDEKLNLIDLATTWAIAAVASQRMFGPSLISSPREAGAATPLNRS
jgi:hypothetical protein